MNKVSQAQAQAQPLRILCVEDSPDDAELIRRSLAGGSWRCEWAVVHDGPGMLAALSPVPDLVLCDFRLPRFSPLEALELLRTAGLQLPLVVVTRSIGEEAAVGVLRAGAADYVTKDRLATLPMVVGRVLAAARHRRKELDLAHDLQQANARLRDMSSRLLRAQESERQRIAGELHDSLGQSLTAVLVHTHAAESAADPQVGTIYRQTARKVLEQAIRQVKTLSFAMRPPQLDLLGLEATLEALAGQLLRPTGVAFEQRCSGRPTGRGDESEVVAFRIAQEALSNVARHSGARKVRLRMRYASAGRLRLTIADDGCGFDVAAVLRSAPSSLQRGLTGMMERCELVGGRLRLRSRPGRGTVLVAQL